MYLLDYLLQRLGLRRAPKAQKIVLDDSLRTALNSLAGQQQRPPNEIAKSEVTRSALRPIRGELWNRWLALSPREQQVAALTCLGFTNPQMAARLNLSVETVRTHTRSVHSKFQVSNKADLRVLLSEWDFSGWDCTEKRFE